MTERWWLAWLAAPLAVTLSAHSAEAVGNRLGPRKPPPTLAKYVQDLTHSNAARRSYAGRVLLRQVKSARRAAATGPEDDLTKAGAMQVLVDFDQQVAPTCTRHLNVREITAACADILRLLETQTALSALQAQLQVETRRKVKKRLQKAISRIEAVKK